MYWRDGWIKNFPGTQFFCTLKATLWFKTKLCQIFEKKCHSSLISQRWTTIFQNIMRDSSQMAGATIGLFSLCNEMYLFFSRIAVIFCYPSLISIAIVLPISQPPLFSPSSGPHHLCPAFLRQLHKWAPWPLARSLSFPQVQITSLRTLKMSF